MNETNFFKLMTYLTWLKILSLSQLEQESVSNDSQETELPSAFLSTVEALNVDDLL